MGYSDHRRTRLRGLSRGRYALLAVGATLTIVGSLHTTASAGASGFPKGAKLISSYEQGWSHSTTTARYSTPTTCFVTTTTKYHATTTTTPVDATTVVHQTTTTTVAPNTTTTVAPTTTTTVAETTTTTTEPATTTTEAATTTTEAATTTTAHQTTSTASGTTTTEATTTTTVAEPTTTTTITSDVLGTVVKPPPTPAPTTDPVAVLAVEVSPDDTLPVTGTPSAPLILLGTAFLVVGIALTVVGQARRASR